MARAPLKISVETAGLQGQSDLIVKNLEIETQGRQIFFFRVITILREFAYAFVCREIKF